MRGKSGDGRKGRKSRLQTLKEDGEGSATGLLQEALRRHPANPLMQARYFSKMVKLPAFTGREREVADLTRRRFGQTLMQALVELRGLNMRIQRIDQISRRHIVALVMKWKTKDRQAAGTIQTKLSHLRKFCTLIGKREAIPYASDLDPLLQAKGLPTGSLKREQVASLSKSWSAQGFVPEEKIAEIQKQHPREAMHLEMMHEWGLRVSEVLSLQPYRALRSDGLHVERGTKGGKPRMVLYKADPQAAARQREALSRSLEWADASRGKHLGYPGLTMKQTRRRFYYVMEKYGITKKDLGITSHGLRHEFAAGLFEDTTGHRPPVENTESAAWFKANPQAVEGGKRRVTEALGHWRLDVTGAYIGSVARMTRLQKQRITHLTDMVANTPGLAVGLVEAKVVRIWLTGRSAQGIKIADYEKPILTMLMQPDANMDSLVAADTLLKELVPVRMTLVPWLKVSPPEDGVEIFLKP